MRNRKLERALYGPTVYEITIGVLLSVVLGAALAIAFLIFKPAVVVQEMPKQDEIVRGTKYYVEGTSDLSKSKQWMRKRQALVESIPGEISLNEDELNVWFLSSTEHGQKILEKKAIAAAEAAKQQAKTKAGAKPPAKPAAPEPAPETTQAEAPPTELFTCKEVNFRIRDNVVQVGLPSTVTLPFGYQFPVVVQTHGGFEKRDDMYVFVPDEFWVGSLPMHRFPNAVQYIMEKAMHDESLPPELLAAWKKVKTVVVDGQTLKISI